MLTTTTLFTINRATSSIVKPRGLKPAARKARKIGICTTLLTMCGLVLSLASTACAQESSKQWFRQGQEAVARVQALKPIEGPAKNIILFIGDGMGIATVTAARIFAGQQRGQSGEENFLSFEHWPYSALVKTYNTNQQTPDSAGTMSAIVTGVKTKAGFLSVGQAVTRGDAQAARKHTLTTILELAEKAGLSTGVVSTAEITHATPAACYAHSPDREWCNDTLLSPSARQAGFLDIARQLIEFPIGNGLEVALGGGRRHFLPQSVMDPEYTMVVGSRQDNRDLTKAWLTKPNSVYVWNQALFDAVDPTTTDHLLGLFEPFHMKYEHDRSRDKSGEPSLSEMTAKAIDVLSKNQKGFFLMVEGGRIDHAHHEINAYRALTETVEFARAVSVAADKTDSQDTLLIVTADHSHVFSMGGYSKRGHPILGKVVENDPLTGEPQTITAKDLKGRPYTTLSYANGPKGLSEQRSDLTNVDTTDPNYRQQVLVPLLYESHSGEDVPLYAVGPMAHLFHGVIEQNVIFHIMAVAMHLKTTPPK